MHFSGLCQCISQLEAHQRCPGSIRVSLIIPPLQNCPCVQRGAVSRLLPGPEAQQGRQLEGCPPCSNAWESWAQQVGELPRDPGPAHSTADGATEASGAG